MVAAGSAGARLHYGVLRGRRSVRRHAVREPAHRADRLSVRVRCRLRRIVRTCPRQRHSHAIWPGGESIAADAGEIGR